MEDQSLPFPYKFEELEEDEKALVRKVFPSNMNFIRVGPKGYIVTKPYEKDAANIYNMPLRPSDIFVASYQRSGTTWTQELIWLLANDLDFDTAAKIPLTHRYSFLDMFMGIDENITDDYIKLITEIHPDVDVDKVRQMIEVISKPISRSLVNAPSPRFIKTHMPMSMLPPSIVDIGKVVYVARDPRDVAVSSYHHGLLFHLSGVSGEFKEFWNLFYQNLFKQTPIFEHIKEAWEQRNHPNMLFLFYEDLSKDLPAAVRRVAEFLGKNINEEQMARLCDHLSIDNFKKNKSINYEELREFGMLSSKETFIRKGKTGGWHDYFDEEMTQQAERWIAENLKDTDLRFPSMTN